MTFRAYGITVTDMLRFSSKTVTNDTVLEIPVFPPREQMEFQIPKKRFTGDEDYLISDTGDPTRDLRQVREYRPTDRLKDIHWKLTAASDDIKVMEFEKTKELYCMVIPELEYEQLQDTLGTFYSLCLALTDMGEVFKCVITDTKSGMPDIRTVSCIEDVTTVMLMLFRTIIPKNSTASFIPKSKEDGFGEFIRVRGKDIIVG